MSEPGEPGAPRDAGPGLDDLPEAELVEKSRLSIVWVVPLVAAIAGAFLAYRAISEQGPTVRIRFETATGLEAGKTQVRYKDVQIGLVEAIDLSEELDAVWVTASLVDGAERYLREETRFWVVRARISAGQVSGLGTVLSGAYIGVDPVTEGPERREFVGLEVPPVVTHDDEGTLVSLRSDRLGSLDRGSPVLYRSMRVGQVVGYELDAEGERLTIHAFVEAPHDARIDSSTRFWNASGLDVSIGAEGVRLDTPSLVALLMGGVAFETPPAPEPAAPVAEDTFFWLYPDRESTRRRTYSVQARYLLYFDQSVAGLSPGAPVEFRGLRVGTVEDVHLALDPELAEIRIPVQIVIEPERFASGAATEDARTVMERLVAHGLHARLATANLLTGALLVDFALDESGEPGEIDYTGRYPALPTTDGSLQAITGSVARIAERLEAVPFDEIGSEAQKLVARLSDLVVELDGLTGTVDRDIAPVLGRTLAELSTTLDRANGLLAPDSPAAHELQRTLLDLSDAVRSLRVFAEELEESPESLLRGRRE